MADVFSQIYIHLIFSPKRREALIQSSWEERLHKYMTGIVEQRGHKMLAIGGMPDHVHLFIGLKPAEAISDLVREIKTASNDFVKKERLSPFAFDWQNGYGAFSHNRSQMDAVCKYILNQKEHHQKKSFKDEFHQFLKEYEIEIGKKQVFKWFE